jgi:hypothetical protein
MVFRPRPETVNLDSSRPGGQFIAGFVTFSPFVTSMNTWADHQPIHQPIDTSEVNTVNKSFEVRPLRKSLLLLGAAAAISLPLIASANVTGKSSAGYSLLYTTKQSQVRNDPEAVYIKLQNLTYDLCGSPDLHITGSVRKWAKVEACYEETLTAAVERLDRPEVTKLHRN